MSDCRPSPLRLDTGRLEQPDLESASSCSSGDVRAAAQAGLRSGVPASTPVSGAGLVLRRGVTTAELEGGKPAPVDSAPLSLPALGDVLDGHYRLGHELGRGGMGVVFEAENLRTGQAVAIKCLTNRGRDGGGRSSVPAERMRREARAIAKIFHPHVVQVYDLGGTDCAPFLIMELLKGETLLQRLARGRFDWDEALRVILPVIDAVHAVHNVGIVHRDLKPDNIFLCAVDGEQTTIPKVLDFGVAAWSSSASEELATLTRTGSMLGTPAYMALEQLTGGPSDRRTDIYSLASVLYEMLTAEHPYSARTAGELAILQATTRPRRPSLLNATVSGERESVLLKALSKNPQARFEDAAQFAQALKNARPAPRFARLRSRIVAVSAVTLVASLAFRFAHTTESRRKAEAGNVMQQIIPAEENAKRARSQESMASSLAVPSFADTPEGTPGTSMMTPEPAVVGPLEPASPVVAPQHPRGFKRERVRRGESAPRKLDSRQPIQIELEDFYEEGRESARQ